VRPSLARRSLVAAIAAAAIGTQGHSATAQALPDQRTPVFRTPGPAPPLPPKAVVRPKVIAPPEGIPAPVPTSAHELAITGPNGEPRDPTRWPATLYFEGFTKASGCTVSLIGPRVLLTAAHCLAGARKAAIALRVPNTEAAAPVGKKLIVKGPRARATTPDVSAPSKEAKSLTVPLADQEREVVIELTCEPHPGHRLFAAARYLDYGLCHLNQDFPEYITMTPSKGGNPKLASPKTVTPQAGDGERRAVPVLFERLSLDPKDSSLIFAQRESRRLLISGYGCTKSDERSRDGTFNTGFATVTSYGPVRLTMGSVLLFESFMLCAGDSGGAAYRVRGATPESPRLIVAVNSANLLSRRTSFLSRTSAPAFVNFFQAWRRKWGMPKVCGLDAEIEPRCRLGK
jgi:Trypsin